MGNIGSANTSSISTATTASSASSASSSNVHETVSVNGVSFNMVHVDGGTFTMGATPEQGNDVYDNEKPAHQVTLSSYMIGETEVTQALWQAVMGKNPSIHGNNLNNPVETVSWKDCQEFIKKLNKLTGKKFRLPTEAEWEFAARGGNKSKGYKYSGSNNIDEVAWYKDNRKINRNPVKMKKSNELGLYDMTGGVWEWCSDWFDTNYFKSSPQLNPKGPSSGSRRVYRGGGDYGEARICRISIRYSTDPGESLSIIGLRLAMDNIGAANTSSISTATTASSASSNTSASSSSSSRSRETVTVNGVSFNMVRVDGGTFKMGATPEQESDADYWEKPVHEVTLSSYMIGETEVTLGLWQAVMGSKPKSVTYDDSDFPIEGVSWNDCQKFIKKLNQLTGKKFRLPTEAEWEFAARGGNKSKGYKYSGSNNLDEVAWYEGNKNQIRYHVKMKKPNELGIYDMSGCIGELCNDWFYDHYYQTSPQQNPQGPSTGEKHVYRGGYTYSSAKRCRTSFRGWQEPNEDSNNVGFRLAQ